MQTYNPNSTDITSLISAPAEQPKAVPEGLIRDTAPPPEKNLEELQMAEFSSAIDEVMPGPGQMIQDKVQGSAFVEQPPPTKKESKGSKGGKNPFGLEDDQYFAALAGVAAVIAFSKPVQNKLSSMVPKFMEDGALSLPGMAVTALIAAIVFYFARKFLTDRD